MKYYLVGLSLFVIIATFAFRMDTLTCDEHRYSLMDDGAISLCMPSKYQMYSNQVLSTPNSGTSQFIHLMKSSGHGEVIIQYSDQEFRPDSLQKALKTKEYFYSLAKELYKSFQVKIIRVDDRDFLVTILQNSTWDNHISIDSETSYKNRSIMIGYKCNSGMDKCTEEGISILESIELK